MWGSYLLLVKHDLWFGHSPQFTNMSVNLMVTWLQNCITYVQRFVGIGVCYLCSFISSSCISSLGTNRMYKLRKDIPWDYKAKLFGWLWHSCSLQQTFKMSSRTLLLLLLLSLVFSGCQSKPRPLNEVSW